MRLTRYVGVVLLFPVAPCFAQHTPVACLSYEPAIVQITGTLVRTTYPGPPNYENIRKGDRVETYWLINLNSPACVNENKAEPDLDPELKSVTSIQLVLNANAYHRFKSLMGKRVAVSGTLSGGNTGHNHTRVLLTIRDMKKANRT